MGTRLVNLIKNGNFEYGTNNWSNVRDCMHVVSNVSVTGQYSLRCDSANGMYVWCSSNVFHGIAGHILYVSAMNVNNDASTAFGLYVNDNGEQTQTISVASVGSVNYDFVKVSQYVTLPELPVNTINLLLYGECNVANIYLISYWTDVLCVDLTACFGAGREPTKAWCDNHISWFEGSVILEDNGYILHNQIEDPLFLFHTNASDLYNHGLCCRESDIYLTNLVTNGSFETGEWATNWNVTGVPSSDYVTIRSDYTTNGSYSVNLNCKTDYGYAQAVIFGVVIDQTKIIAGHKYYGRVWYLPYDFSENYNAYANGELSFDLVGGAVEKDFCYVTNNKDQDSVWQRFSNIITADSNTGNYLRIYNYAKNQVIVDEFMLIDLTAAFGAGNEPSLAWCDSILWFDGITIINDYGFGVEKIDGEAPPHSSCIRTWGSMAYDEIVFETKKSIGYNINQKYYAAYDFYPYDDNAEYNLYFPCGGIYPSLSENTEGMIVERNKPTAIANVWQRASMIVSGYKVPTGKYPLRFDNDNARVGGRTIRYTNLMLINLTAAFGAGNEPSLAWCDKYFVLDSDGTPHIRSNGYSNDYISNNTNHINFIMKQKTKKVKVKIQSLDYSDNVIGEIKGLCRSGTIDITNGDMVRRSINLDMLAHNSIEINRNSPFWINKRFRIYTGIDDYRNNTYWFDHGIFLPTEPNTNISLTGRTISINALDKMMLADNPVLTATKIAVGTPIGNAIRAFGELYGETKFLISNYDYTLPYDYEMSAGDNIQDGLKDIANLYMNFDIYYDINGFLVYEKQKNRINDASVWDFSGTNDFTIQRKISADYQKVYNDFKVFGYYDDTTALQPSYQITITDDTHPFSVNNLHRRHSLVVTEDNYLTVEQCQARAEYEKQQAENLINNFSITTVPIYSLNDVNRVIKVTDNGNKYTCLVDSISYPLDVDSTMNISCHEIFI